MSRLEASHDSGTRRCVTCGTSIEHLGSAARSCNGACRAEASRRRRGIEIARTTEPCSNCGGEIVGRRADAVYCGAACKREAARARSTPGASTPVATPMAGVATSRSARLAAAFAEIPTQAVV